MKKWMMFLSLLLTAASADLTTLDELTGRWMSLREARAREAEAWQDEQRRLELELTLLREAEEQLAAELATLRAREDETETEQADLLAELETRTAAESALRPTLDASRDALRQRVGRLPPSLQETLTEDRMALEATGPGTSARLRTLLSLHNQLLQLQTRIHAAPQLISLEGESREMDILWIGDAMAFAVSRDGQRAARGTPGEEGWTWAPLPHPAPIREALRQVRRESPPRLLDLPVEARP